MVKVVSNATAATMMKVSCVFMAVMAIAVMKPDPVPEEDGGGFLGKMMILKGLSYFYFGFSCLLAMNVLLIPVYPFKVGPWGRNFMFVLSILCFLDGIFSGTLYMLCLWEIRLGTMSFYANGTAKYM